MSASASGCVKLVARQPIFDRAQRVYGYELLFRPDPDLDACRDAKPTASLELIGDSLMLHDFTSLVDQGRAFVNLSRQDLLAGHGRLLPKECSVLEVLESVEPDRDVLGALGDLRRSGYMLALDDVIDAGRIGAFAGLVQIAKIDFACTTPQGQELLLRTLREHNIAALAEKVETKAQFRAAAAMGFHLFQGFFFARPEIVRHHDVAARSASQFRLLQALQRSPIEVAELERLIKQEPAFAYKLLRYLNSPLFGFRHRIGSIRHAITLLGEDEVRRWASMTAFSLLAGDEPTELALTALRRALLCEQLAGHGNVGTGREKLFLAGLLSTLEAILNCPRAALVNQLPLDQELQSALLGPDSALGATLRLAEAYDCAEWDSVQALATGLKLEDADLVEAYRSAVQRSREYMAQA